MEGLSSKWSQIKQSFSNSATGNKWSWKLGLQAGAILLVCLVGLGLLTNGRSESEEQSERTAEAEEDLLRDLEELSAQTSIEQAETESTPRSLDDDPSQQARSLSKWGNYGTRSDWTRSSRTSGLQTAEFQEEAEREETQQEEPETKSRRAAWLTGTIEEVESDFDSGFDRRQRDNTRFPGNF